MTQKIKYILYVKSLLLKKKSFVLNKPMTIVIAKGSSDEFVQHEAYYYK